MNSIVPNLRSLKVGDETLALHDLLQAPYEDISEAAEQLPAAIGWLGYQRAIGIERMILSEQAWKKAEATQYFELKNGGFISGGFGDKPTEDALKRALLLTPQVEEACADYAMRKRHVEWVSASIEALKAKLELVRSSEATRRMEHEPDRGRSTRD